ncbi:sensor histidine kinase [Alkalihalobacillus sp. MEB130]|uniref:sensor histidine kinase n=1 Tax=Alkalihalobacillus sp. MEB130 TaxID=2976704 RepID=UPI0028DFAC0A|nr:sensor histidine kinase [Alkalihalobacillus sp. MEB130]MDT8858932.1 sensor histidine kinase [Alkalihalobacillus sp. MEB130]
MKWKEKLNSIVRIILLRDFSLMVKLCIYFALLILIPMCTVAIISYKHSANILEKEVEQYNSQIIEQVQKHVEYYVRDLKLDTLKVIHQPDVLRFLEMGSKEEVEASGIAKSIRALFRDAAGFRADINNITIVSEGMETIDLMGSTFSNADLEEELWYSSVPLTGETILFSRNIPWHNRMEPVVSIARRVANPQTLELTGMIIVDVNYKRFQEIAERVQVGQTGFMYILDSQGNYLYHRNLASLGQQAEVEDSGRLLDGQGSLIVNNGERQFLTYSHSSFLGWTLVISTPYKEMTKGIREIGRTILFTSIIALVVASLLGMALSRSVIRPIRKLQSFMQRIEKGDFSSRLKVESRDEVGQLTEGFNVMVSKLAQLLDEIYISRLNETQMSLRHKETELKALQSQINPHFLYNSLDTIRGMALEQDMDDIGDMAGSLARLLRYNLKNRSFLVPVKEEVRACEVYLRIQKYRFGDRLDYQFHIDEWALEQSIVKFCLQPLVENSMIHGIEPSTGKAKLSIASRLDTSSSFIIEIADTGVGMTEESLQKINENLSNNEMSHEGKHIGLINVHKRIVYLFGEDYGLQIEGKEQEGTTVKIRLPLNRSLEDNE